MPHQTMQTKNLSTHLSDSK